MARAIYDFLGMDAAFIDMDAYYVNHADLPLSDDSTYVTGIELFVDGGVAQV